MDFLLSYLPNFSDVFTSAFHVFINGGWVLFVLGLLYMFYYSYKHEIEHQYLAELGWVFLEIKVPKENLTSTLAVESIFTQMHVIHSGINRFDKYIQGKFQLWYSLEIVSIGGKISFIIRVPDKFKHLVESAFYSQYPDAEIREVEDYIANFNFDPENSEFDLTGVEFKLAENSSIPLKTYKDFEHTAAEEKVIDTLSNLFQSMERLEPYEFFAVQILATPTSEDEWHKDAKKNIKKLIGEEEEHHTGFYDFLMTPFNWFANFSYKDTFFGGGHGHGHDDEKKPKNNWTTMTEGEKERVSLIERKMSKPAYGVKIRHLYIAPNELFDKSRKLEMVGAYRHLSSGFFNILKTNGKIWGKSDPIFSPALEKAQLERIAKKKKVIFLRGFKNRSNHVGGSKFILNTEEIATLYHFPITTKPITSAVNSTESKKVQPPTNLPIGEL